MELKVDFENCKLMRKVRLTIGDWSNDGHEKSEYFIYSVNKDVTELREAYKNSCKLTGVQFNHSENYTGLAELDEKMCICVQYEENQPSKKAVDALKAHGIDVDKYFDDIDEEEGTGSFNPEGLAEVIMEFIKLSIPDLQFEEASFKKSKVNRIPPINGWWIDELNVSFGYGLFD